MKVILKLQTKSEDIEIPLLPNQSVVCGRSSRADQKVQDDLMSSTHCKFILTPPKLMVYDLDSKNGTFINGIRIEQSEIFLGDEIKIGSTKALIKADTLGPHEIIQLTFPGRATDRVSHSLKLDFAGARTLNQSLKALSGKKRPSSNSISTEIELRLKANSQIKLSKEEIRLKYRKIASLGSTLDIVFFIISTSLPLIILNVLVLMDVKEVVDHKLNAILILEVFCIGLFLLLNYKLMKFTLGEKFSGVEEIYLKQ